MHRFRLSSLLLPGLLALGSAGSLFGQLESRESEDIRIIYPGGIFSYLVPHIAACSENALKFHRDLYHYKPDEKVTIFLEDFSDFGHGGATTVPTDFVNFGIAPFNYVYETVPAIDRMYWMSNHEMAHIVTMDQASGRDRSFRSFFRGKVDPVADDPLSIFYNYLTTPRWNAPRWYHEGIAVFLETWMAGGLGRVLGGYDEMVFRSMVLDERYFYDIVGLESEGTTIDFQVGVNSYLYGTRFMSYLAYRYEPEKLIEWTGRQPGSRAYFSSQFEAVYGVSLDQEWSNWIEWEHDWQRANLEAIRRHPITPFQPISETTLGSVSRTFFDDQHRKLYVAIRYPGQLAHLAALDIDSGEVERLTDVQGAALFYVTSLAYDPDHELLFFTTDNYGWRDLRSFDLKERKQKRLIRDLRVGDLAFNRADRSLWGVRHFNGISTLVRIPYPYQAWEQVHSWPYGQDLYDIDISPDGTVLSGALAEVSGRQSLIRAKLADLLAAEPAGDPAVETLFDFENSSPANFVFSEDGKYLYGSSYYSGVSNIYRYDLEKGEMNALSNSETGLFRPMPISDDQLIAFRYTGRGLVPGIVPNRVPERVSAIRFLGNAIVEKYPIVQRWQVPSPATVDAEKLVTRSGRYNSFTSMRMNSFYPIVQGYRDTAAVGVRLNVSDPLNLSGFHINASYSPDRSLPADERVHVDFELHHWDWEIHANYNGADFYDLFGPTKTSRRGYALGMGYNKTLWYDEPRAVRVKARVTGYGNLDTLPEYQNVAAPFDKLLSASAVLEYEFLRRSLGAVDDEKGTRWQIIGSSNYAGSNANPRVLGNFEYGIPLPIDHSSIWIRSSAGHSFGDPEDPFGQFFFGGFGNNYVDQLSEKRYREYYSFPGVELNEVGGKNYGKALLEWTLPPLRFRSLGRPAFYANWARFALFGSALRTNFDDAAKRRTLANVGGQVDFKLVLFSNLSSTLSLGYAVAMEEGQKAASEFMISLKIL